MTATTFAAEGRQLPRPRHLRLVPAVAGGPDARPRVAGAAWPGEPRLRLTRRGRRVVAALLWSGIATGVALTVLFAVLLFGGSAEAGEDAGRIATVEHVVRPGETLWSIASAWAPDQDPRDGVERLAEFNALPGVDLVAGQRLLLPERE